MDKNSLILEIKNDLNSIKKQVEVALAKLTVLESMIELDNKLGVSVAEPVEAPVEELGVRSEELGVEEPAPIAAPVAEPVEAPVEELGVRSEELGVEEPAPIAAPVAEPVEAPEQEMCRDNSCIVRESEQEPEPESEIELEEEITPNSSLHTPNCEALELRNLMSVIGLNDRFRFRHDLFSNSDELFKETIDILNKIEDFDKAVDYLVQKFAWDEEDATVVYFYDIIKPKF